MKQKHPVNQQKFPKGGEIPERGRRGRPGEPEFVIKSNNILKNKELVETLLFRLSKRGNQG